ncbi:MAG: pyruvate:ferredoxin (flavodoxin) oxidoreductase, partial [Clostridia bacterium]
APIKSTYYISKADFVACSNPAYLGTYDMVSDLKVGGSFLLNCDWSAEELETRLPGEVKRYIADNKINFYTIDGFKIGKEIGLGTRINTVLQSAFFTIANVIDVNDAIKYMKDAATKSYSKKGDMIVKMNHDAIDAGNKAFVKIDVPESWKTADNDSVSPVATGSRADLVDYVNNVVYPVNAFKGKDLPVSTFEAYANGESPQGTAAYEKRGIAVDVPEWDFTKCIQCNQCSYVCPHAVIRPVVMTDEELVAAPKQITSKPMTGIAGLNFTMSVSIMDCTGCGSCAQVCPAKGKALVMKSIDSQRPMQDVFDYGTTIDAKPEVAAKFKETSVKGSQFKQPLLEFSGACGGCGETPYAKLATQLFGDKMFIANATGCSSIWGGSAPATPYTVNKKGHGPAWQNSLFEDNAEFGLGMTLAQNAVRGRLEEYILGIIEASKCDEMKEICQNYIDTKNDSRSNGPATEALIAKLETKVDCDCTVGTLAKKILADKDFLAKKSMWIFGGDGWAYDIGFGGVDHTIASGENINILVFDTEVYSNTGGQASKASPAGSVAQFAASGKATKKKDLAAIAMSYGYVYVAQIAMGADMNQCIKAFEEAESYNGPSLIIAYAPCINHGIKGGMGISMAEEKKAVAAGYWHNFRFDPRKADEGVNPFKLDSKAPSASYRDFIMGEVRYNSLVRSFPDRAEILFTEAEKHATDKYDRLKKMSE